MNGLSMEMYEMSVPQFKKILLIVSSLLKKTSKQIEHKKMPIDLILNASLAPDMLNFTRQIQITTDFIKNGSGRLAGIDLMKIEDNEKTFEELHSRIIKVISYLNQIKPEQINGTEKKDINFTVGQLKFDFKGLEFLQSFVIPNIYFHLTIAYAILRNNNFNIGKKDYLGSLGTSRIKI